jgi:predicted O-linked N-acetylglucosamine transferase (SPINDLY family)
LSKDILIEAINLQKDGHLEEAKIKYKKLLLVDKKNFDAYYFLSWIAYDQKNYNLGIDLITKAININSNTSKAFNLLGLLLKQLENFNEAVKNFQIASDLDANNFESFVNLGGALASLFKFEEAIKNFKIAIKIKDDDFMSYNNIGFCLLQLNKYEESLYYLNKAIFLKDDFAPTYLNRAKINSKLNKNDSALLDFNFAITHSSNESEYYFERGLFFKKKRDFLLALQDLEKAYSLNSDFELLLGNILHLVATIFDFEKKITIINQSLIDIKENKLTIHPWMFLLVNDDIDLQLKITKNFLQKRYLKNFEKDTYFFDKKSINEKIKIAYFSSDFGDHPVSRQIVELFELHDRNDFEIFLFSLENKPNSLLKERIINSCDHFINVENKTYSEIIALVRDLNIDIAVDLNGHTDGSKTFIFQHKIAPIQINYLGYAGTMGANFMDYLIADKNLIPLEAKDKYVEKIIYLPNSFMVNDRKKLISKKLIKKSDFQLPENALIFCSFNNIYKINENIFDVWLEILENVKNSVLWLGQTNDFAKKNILKKCENKKFSLDRIIFAKSVENHEIHLARHKLADLTLDTFPYNSHSTGCESLWTGVPIITLIGKCYHSRVVASLLYAIDLPELVTTTLEDYKNLAINLGVNFDKLRVLKIKLEKNLLNKPLFDTPLYTKNLESAYKKIYKRYQLDQKPDHIYINE